MKRIQEMIQTIIQAKAATKPTIDVWNSLTVMKAIPKTTGT